MEEFFNLLEEIKQRSESRRSEKAVQMQARTVAGRLPSRPACTTCTGATQSTAQSTVARRVVDQSGRLTGMANFLLDSVDRPVNQKEGSVDCPVGR